MFLWKPKRFPSFVDPTGILQHHGVPRWAAEALALTASGMRCAVPTSTDICAVLCCYPTVAKDICCTAASLENSRCLGGCHVTSPHVTAKNDSQKPVVCLVCTKMLWPSVSSPTFNIFKLHVAVAHFGQGATVVTAPVAILQLRRCKFHTLRRHITAIYSDIRLVHPCTLYTL